MASILKVHQTLCPGGLGFPLPKTGKKRSASEYLEVKAPKRGKMSLSGGSGSEDDVVAQFHHKDKPLAES